VREHPGAGRIQHGDAGSGGGVGGGVVGRGGVIVLGSGVSRNFKEFWVSIPLSCLQYSARYYYEGQWLLNTAYFVLLVIVGLVLLFRLLLSSDQVFWLVQEFISSPLIGSGVHRSPLIGPGVQRSSDVF
jgi:hypothetical protein